MASVWILEEHYPCEYDGIMGVFATEEGAEAEKELILAQPDDTGKWDYAYMTIEKYEVQNDG